MRLQVRALSLRLARPLHTSYGTLAERPLLVVSVTGADGVSGHGEAAPLEPYEGVSAERTLRALRAYELVLSSLPEPDEDRRQAIAGALQACRRVDSLPAALAAVEMALWDRAGRQCGMPLAALLSERPARAVAVNALIDARDPPEAAAQAARARREGFGCVKVKVGLPDDDERVAAVRAGAGPDAALRLDANGAWTVAEAERAIAALAPARPELIEEPVHGVAALRELRVRVSARIAIDETAGEEGALDAGVADAVCLKLARCAGVSGALAAAARVRAAGAQPYLSSSLDGPLATAAALHVAAVLSAGGPLPHCGLATLSLFEGLEDPLPARGGRIELPPGPGLGVEPLG